ncbi:MAG: tail fiber protein [Bacteroidota bacterium]
MHEEYLLGSIMMFGGNFAPRKWALCDGQLLPIAQHQALYSLLGTYYGGDGRRSFALPDLRGRIPIHSGNGENGPGLHSYPLGQKIGIETNTLTHPTLPAHHHGLPAIETSASGNGQTFVKTNKSSDVQIISTQATGSGQPINNVQPSTVVNFCIALEGEFPSRT